jgi:hypothetical protein
MVRPGTKRALVAVWTTVHAAMWPESTRDAGERRALEDEAQRSNARIMRWFGFVAVPVNALPAVLLLDHPERDPAGATWLFWTLGLNAVLAALAILAGFVAWRGRPVWLWRALGNVAAVVGLLGAAARSANTQRAYPNINLFIIAAVITALFLRVQPQVFVPTLLAGTAMVLGGTVHFRQGGTARLADELVLIAVSSVAVVGFFVTRTMRIGELLARRQVELLNADLAQRVEAQVHEIVVHAREIEELNTQLNEKIQERSRELSRALARLAEGHGAIEPGTVLGGRVEVGAEIGRGGMGVVYRGRDRITGKTVAVKVVQAGSVHELDSLQRFLREARAMASVTHDAIVRSIHVDVSEDGRLFQMMELVEGETLEAYLTRSTSLPPPVASRLGAVLAAGLAAAHQAGVVHRDVKPSNVMLTRTPPGLKLLDFGISKLREAHLVGSHTQQQILGTPEFLSPEQVNDPGNVSVPSDVYALGIVLYLCAAGRLPFEVESSRRFLMTHVLRAPVELISLLPDVDPTLASTVMACLQKAPARRPTASAVADALSRIADAAGIPPLDQLGLVHQGRSMSPKVPESAPTMKS